MSSLTTGSAESGHGQEFLHFVARCPCCHFRPLQFATDAVVCTSCRTEFPVVQGKPALIRQDNPLFPLRKFISASPRKIRKRERRWISSLISPSVNLSFCSSLEKIKLEMQKSAHSHILVIGTGNQRKTLEKFFPPTGSTQLVCCDVDLTADLDLFCDAHELPFSDESFQGVVITAVLQHVLNPQLVASEMFRVLSVGGLVYSEVAFMQQVCEGAYDFTRYSLSGHRVLLNQFRELSAGIVAGPATALIWAIENLVLSFFERRWLRSVLKAVVRFVFSWLKYFDYFLQNRPGSVDGASCTYFLGMKDGKASHGPQSVVDAYIGMKHLRHL